MKRLSQEVQNWRQYTAAVAAFLDFA